MGLRQGQALSCLQLLLRGFALLVDSLCPWHRRSTSRGLNRDEMQDATKNDRAYRLSADTKCYNEQS